MRVSGGAVGSMRNNTRSRDQFEFATSTRDCRQGVQEEVLIIKGSNDDKHVSLQTLMLNRWNMFLLKKKLMKEVSHERFAALWLRGKRMLWEEHDLIKHHNFQKQRVENLFRIGMFWWGIRNCDVEI